MTYRRTLSIPLTLAVLGAPSALAQPFEPEDSTRWMQLRVASGACLEADHDRIYAASCSDDPSQIWSFQDDHLVSADGRCVTLGRGARVRIAECADRPEQRFTFEDELIVDDDGRCLGLDRRSRLGVFACDDGAHDLRVEALPPGFHEDLAPEARFEEIDAPPAWHVPGPYAPEPYAPEPSVVITGPATVYVPPAPAPPDPVEQVFHVVDHAIHSFRSIVDIFAPGAFRSPALWLR